MLLKGSVLGYCVKFHLSGYAKLRNASMTITSKIYDVKLRRLNVKAIRATFIAYQQNM